MFQFRRFPTYDYFIHHTLTDSSSAGFPHSEIHGSLAAFASPWLFVDRYVLRRLLVPRHSPYALSSLTILQLALLNNPMLESFWFFGFSLDDKIIVVFTLKYFYHFTFTCACSVFKVHLILCKFAFSRSMHCIQIHARSKKVKLPKFGGLKWTRTTDLTLIRRAL